MPKTKKREFNEVGEPENAKGKKPRSKAEMAEFAEKAIGKYIKLHADDVWKEEDFREGVWPNISNKEWARVVPPSPYGVTDPNVLHIIQPNTSKELRAIRSTAGFAPGDPVYPGINDGNILFGTTKTVPVDNYKTFLDEQTFKDTIANKRGWLRFGGKKRKRKTRKRKKTRRRNKKKRKSRRKKTRR